MGRISVVIADQYPVVLKRLSTVLGTQPDFTVVARCADKKTLIEAIRIFTPDIAIVDISMPGIGLREIHSIANPKRSTRVVLFTAFGKEDELVALAEAGAYGFIAKDAEPELLVQSLRQVANGQRLLPLSGSGQAAREKSVRLLTERERQILRLVSEGLSNKEIGRRLNVTDGTIKVHLHNIFEKLLVSNRTALAAVYFNHGSGNQGKGPDHE
jgi:two-component system, NarL family, nitrate/nitrite response regulator NarL